MGPSAIVVGQEGRQSGGAFGAVGVASGISPFPQASLDETLGLAVSLWPAGHMKRNWRHNAVGLKDEKQREPHTESASGNNSN
jgi:hypothetical protein